MINYEMPTIAQSLEKYISRVRIISHKIWFCLRGNTSTRYFCIAYLPLFLSNDVSNYIKQADTLFFVQFFSLTTTFKLKTVLRPDNHSFSLNTLVSCLDILLRTRKSIRYRGLKFT